MIFFTTTTSPIANIPLTFVSNLSLISILPLLSILTPIFSAFNLSVNGLLPVAIKITSLSKDY
mgnify:CR=1 FL=1